MNENYISNIAHESDMGRMEQTVKRLWAVVIILIVTNFLSFVLLGIAFQYETQFEDVVTTETVTQEAESGGNNVYHGNIVGGDYYGEADGYQNN